MLDSDTKPDDSGAPAPPIESPEAAAARTAQETADAEAVAEQARQAAAAQGSAPTPGEPGYVASEEGSAASTEPTNEPEAAVPIRRTPMDELPKGTRIERTRSGFRVTPPEGRAVSGTTFVEAMQAAFPHLFVSRN